MIVKSFKNVTISDVEYVQKMVRLSNGFFRKLQRRKSVRYALLFIRYRVKIVRRLTDRGLTAIFYVRRVEKILFKLRIIGKKIETTRKRDKEGTFTGTISKLVISVACYLKKTPIEIRENVTINEANEVVKAQLCEKIDILHRMILAQHDLKGASNYMANLRRGLEAKRTQLDEPKKQMAKKIGLMFQNSCVQF